MATLCCDAVAEGLRRVKPTSALDIREGFHMQRNILHTILKLHHRITTGLVTTNGPALGTALGPPALEVVMAGSDATMALQEAVLCPEALTSGLGEWICLTLYLKLSGGEKNANLYLMYCCSVI